MAKDNKEKDKKATQTRRLSQYIQQRRLVQRARRDPRNKERDKKRDKKGLEHEHSPVQPTKVARTGSAAATQKTEERSDKRTKVNNTVKRPRVEQLLKRSPSKRPITPFASH